MCGIPQFVMVLGVLAGVAVLRAEEKAATQPATRPASVLDFTVDDMAGKPVDLAQYRGKVLLIVNTASRCGHTPQYEGLERVHRLYKGRGLSVMAFPCNDFGGQEPGSNEQIREFCTTRYNVSFDLFAKIAVKGDRSAPLYRFLTDREANGPFGGPITWNFTKFLVSRAGKVVARFEPGVKPEDSAMIEAIEAELPKAQ